MRRRSFVMGAVATAACAQENTASDAQSYDPELDRVDVAVEAAPPTRPSDPSPWRPFIIGDVNIERRADGVLNVETAGHSALSQMMQRRQLGYHRNSFLTEDIPYAAHGTVAGRGSPKTMCVGAVYEALLRAITLASTTPEFSAAPSLFPLARINSPSFRLWIFSNPVLNFPREVNGRRFGVTLLGADGSRQTLPNRTKSNGAADTFVAYGIGGRVAFEEALPGDFISFNRDPAQYGGHAAIIVRFISAGGHYTETASQETVGLLYFSAQGSTSGLDFREEYFVGTDPLLCRRPSSGGCTVISSDDGELLAIGRLWHPSTWVTDDNAQDWRYQYIRGGRVSMSEAQEYNAEGGQFWSSIMGATSPDAYDADNSTFAEIDPTAGLNIY